ncbi:hypothetical protein XBO1_250001 [Xenorhabdus bovienii str. oregonense]|uniref:Uncharacterized protein n=1 Tax=Xenorhabdus bovienii str. oregonense TaxID=1398202 RepID=A0A077PB50_XENBV|nr:hypothetical protein XBO1_250001 [Xenorhabdus bovienii str. oregonense]
MAINQIAKTGLSSLQVIYYFESLFSLLTLDINTPLNYLLIKVISSCC